MRTAATDFSHPERAETLEKAVAELEKNVEVLMLRTGLPLLTGAVATGCEWMLLQSFYQANAVQPITVTAFHKRRVVKYIDVVLEMLRDDGRGEMADKLSAFAELKGLGASVRRDLRTLRQPGSLDNVNHAAEELQSLLSTAPAVCSINVEEASFVLALFGELRASL